MEDDDERFPKCVLDPRCVLFFGHEGECFGKKSPCFNCGDCHDCAYCVPEDYE